MSAALAPSVAVSLPKYESACRALAEARTIDEVKHIRDEAEGLRAYAQQAKNRQLEIDAAEIRIRAERQVGKLIRAQKETFGLAKAGRKKIGSASDPISVETPPTLADAGIDKHLADRARKLAALRDAAFEGKLIAWREDAAATQRVATDILTQKPRGTFGTGQVEWYTPTEYIELARQVLGTIDLDPASSDIAQATVRAGRYFTETDDGLSHQWHGRVWCNPPYSYPDIELFVDKLLDEVASGRVTEAIALTHNNTDTRWCSKAIKAAAAICFTEGRIAFVAADGVTFAAQGQAFFYFGENVDRFAEAFSEVGPIVGVISPLRRAAK